VAGIAVDGEPVERRADAAAFPAPGLHAFLDRDGRDQQADERVEPPRADDRVAGSVRPRSMSSYITGRRGATFVSVRMMAAG
jgi:hypothetical protein